MSAILSPERCAQGVKDHAVSEHAHKIVQGWFLLHAAAQHALPPSERGQGKKSSPTVGLEITPDAKTPGFDAWLEGSLKGFIGRSTAFNYMAAAKRVGLTLSMTEADALAVATKALESLKLSELYKPAAAALPPAPPAAPDKTQALVQTWLDFGDHLTHLTADESAEQKALFSLPLNKLTELEETTRRALDVIKAARAAVKKGAQ